MGRAPFGYLNVRVNGRALAEQDPESAWKVRRIFELYAFSDHTLDSLVIALWEEGVRYTVKQPRFKRKHLHDILRDRAYIGEVTYKGQWYPGAHEPIIDRATFAEPVRPADGIVEVFVNGRTVWRDGRATGERPGRVLSRESA